jgi:hypothetical protein
VTVKLDIASSVRLCLTVLLLAASIGSACLILSPSMASAGPMFDAGTSQHHRNGACCLTETVSQMSCCSQSPAIVTADPLDRISSSLPPQRAVPAWQDCCGDQVATYRGGPPPPPARSASPLRL